MKIKKSNIYLVVGIIAVFIAGGLFFNQSNESVIVPNKGVIEPDGSEIVAIYNSLPSLAKKLYFQQSDELTKPVPERIVELDQLTIGCFGTNSILQMSASDTNLGGQCCGALKDARGYELQLVALKEFIEKNGNIDLIPTDPYDIPVTHAQKLISLDKELILSSAQQRVYDEATDMSHHGGPCCCKCWKWYMMSGLAKKLIVNYDWNENQISELWDLSSSCGHAEDTNMQRHYNQPDSDHEDGDGHTH